MRTHNTNATAPPLVVGTIHSAGSLRRALRLRPGAVDLLELRVDHFAADPDALLRAAGRLPAPVIVTVRHPGEGGAGGLSARQREALYWEFLPLARYVDVELQSAARLAGLLAGARENGVAPIISDHHFSRTPGLAVLRERWQRARAAAGATGLVKVAGRLDTAADLARLLALFDFAKGAPVSVMGMGPLGQISRLLFARLGSRLNYGYLDTPQVPGQWEATLLKQRVAELFAE